MPRCRVSRTSGTRFAGSGWQPWAKLDFSLTNFFDEIGHEQQTRKGKHDHDAHTPVELNSDKQLDSDHGSSLHENNMWDPASAGLVRLKADPTLVLGCPANKIL